METSIQEIQRATSFSINSVDTSLSSHSLDLVESLRFESTLEGDSSSLNDRLRAESEQLIDSYLNESVERTDSHSLDDIFECPVCKRQFFHKRSLQRHMKRQCPGSNKQQQNSGSNASAGDNDKRIELSYSSNEGNSPSSNGIEDPEKQNCESLNDNSTDLSETNTKSSKTKPKGSKTYSCHICKKRYYLEHNLNKHVLSHSLPKVPKVYSCEICHKEFKWRSNLRAHTIIHTGEKPYVCKTCNKSFNHINSLKSHSKIHSGEKTYCCPFCEKRFLRNAELQSHIQIHDVVGKKFACDRCDKRFAYISALKNHIRSHTGEKPYSCHLCGNTFSLSKSLRAHLKIHNGEKTFECQVCHKMFLRKGDLARHKITHTDMNGLEKNFVCNICDKRFARKDNLTQHLQVHDRKEPLCCTECDRHFYQNSDLDAHLKTHFRIKQYKCYKCSENFTNTDELQVHVQISHSEVLSDEKPFACDECGLRLNNEMMLHEHKCTHSGEKPYPCLFCGKEFAFNKNLKHHIIKVHPEIMPVKNASTSMSKKKLASKKLVKSRIQEEKDHKCQMCDAAFNKATALKVHMVIHNNNRQIIDGKPWYVCDVCDKKFLTNADLTKHKRIHTGERPYECNVCHKRFTQIGHLQSHMTCHSSQKNYVCEICDTRFKYSCSLKKHFRMHTGEKKTIECKRCFDVFKSQKDLNRHVTMEHKGSDKKDSQCVKCATCGQMFNDRLELMQHVANCSENHTSSKSFTCAICNDAFTSLPSLTLHTQSHIKQEDTTGDVQDNDSIANNHCSIMGCDENEEFIDDFDNRQKIDCARDNSNYTSDEEATTNDQFMLNPVDIKKEPPFELISESESHDLNPPEIYDMVSNESGDEYGGQSSYNASDEGMTNTEIDVNQFPLIAEIKKEIMNY